jgi:type IV fimbrial biogenesis protein FimT
MTRRTKHLPSRRTRGFTLIEMMITITILGILMATGLPSLFTWVATSRANAVPEFYLDGLRRAREGAIKYNSAARLVLTANAGNGQFDWQIDWCSPTALKACNDVLGDWSTTASAVSAVAGVPPGPSIFRSAAGLPASTLLAPNTNDDKTEVYFSALGWINSDVQNIRQLTITPSATDVLPVRIFITLAGVAARCNPTLAASDSRGCP